MINSTAPIILFDGVCNLCQWAVRFIIERDPGAIFRFASLQSEVGQRLLAEHGLTISPDPDSIVLIAGGRAYTHTDAALRIARRLSGPWPLLWVFIGLPRALRDPVYRFIARNRYRWFGRQETCWMPTPALRARFLSDTVIS
jgi:predicted DCC family thiol-disulfide oxidoreductase YuxK